MAVALRALLLHAPGEPVTSSRSRLLAGLVTLLAAVDAPIAREGTAEPSAR